MKLRPALICIIFSFSTSLFAQDEAIQSSWSLGANAGSPSSLSLSYSFGNQWGCELNSDYYRDKLFGSYKNKFAPEITGINYGGIFGNSICIKYRFGKEYKKINVSLAAGPQLRYVTNYYHATNFLISDGTIVENGILTYGQLGLQPWDIPIQVNAKAGVYFENSLSRKWIKNLGNGWKTPILSIGVEYFL